MARQFTGWWPELSMTAASSVVASRCRTNAPRVDRPRSVERSPKPCATEPLSSMSSATNSPSAPAQLAITNGLSMACAALTNSVTRERVIGESSSSASGWM